MLHKFKTSCHPDDLCSRPNAHFKRHSLDTVACGRKPNDTSVMISAFTAHPPLFTVDSMKAQNEDVVQCCNMRDEQNDNNMPKLPINCLGEELQQRICTKRKEGMMFAAISMMFINIERPQNAKLCNSCEQKALNMQVSDGHVLMVKRHCHGWWQRMGQHEQHCFDPHCH